jgi:hypothetical protein
VVGITGIRFESPFKQVSSPHNIAFFPPKHIEVSSEQGVREVHKYKEKANLHLDQQLSKMVQRKAAANIVEPIQFIIGCPTFLSQLLIHDSLLVEHGFTLTKLACTVRRAAKNTFPLAFTNTANSQQKAIDVTACQQYLVRFKRFFRTAAHVPSAVFVRNIFPVPERVNNHLRNISFRQLWIQESRFWKHTTQGEFEKRTAPMAYYNIAWGPTMSLYDIERQYPDNDGPWRR